MTEEKRRFTRVPFKIGAELKIDEQSYLIDEITDLSIGGCLASMKENLQVDTHCRLAMNLGGPTSELNVEIEGKIVRTQPGAVAIKFTGVELDSLFHLQNIVRYNASDPDAIEKEIHDNLGIA